MIYFALLLLGICLGSFINALVWRLRQQLDDDGNEKIANSKQVTVDSKRKNTKLTTPDSQLYSVVHGRSMCPNCKHQLAAKDLVPVLSWLSLGGKCRYCKKPISKQYPLIELLTGALFVASYVFWPLQLSETWVLVGFVTWLAVLVGLIALAIYDAKWFLLPNRIIYPLIALVVASLALHFVLGRPLSDIGPISLSVLIAGGVFWLLYQISGGNWIGGGDVKLGVLAGLLLIGPLEAFLFLFLASLLGLLYSMPLMATKSLTKASRVPFGPFLIASLILVVLFGQSITNWYVQTFLGL